MDHFTHELMGSAGKKIRDLRIAKKLTQQELGFMLDVSRACISSWELGYRPLTPQNAEKLVDYFEISYEDLFSVSREELVLSISKTMDLNSLNLAGLLQMKDLFDRLKNDSTYLFNAKN